MDWRGIPKDAYGNKSGLDDRAVSYGVSIGVGSGIGAYGRWPGIRENLELASILKDF